MSGSIASRAPSRVLPLRAALLAACLGAPHSAHALDPAKAVTQYVHQVWRTEQGLPTNAVIAIAQTPDGYLWLGTEAGVVRFDGVKFKTYDRRNTPQLVNDSVNAVAVDRAGALWIGTVRGLVRMAGDVVTRYAAPEGFSDDSVRCLTEDRDGNIWIGTATDGLYRYRDGTFTAFKTREGLVDDGVRALVVDRQGGLWIGGRGGLQRFKDGRFTTWTRKQGLVHDYVGALYEDTQGSLWIGTFAGLHRMTGGRLETFTTRQGLSHNLISSIVEDDRRNVWIATYGGGVNRLANGQFSSFTSRHGLPDDFVSKMFLDREGGLWIGSGGLNRLKDGPITAYGAREGLSHEVVRAVYEDAAGVLWVATHGGGLNRFDGRRFEAFGTRQGLPSDVVFALQGDGEGGLWVGCYDGGLVRLRNGRFVSHPDPELPKPTFVTGMVRRLSGDLWLGTFGGGVKHFAQGRLRSITRKDGLSNDVVWALLEDRQGSLWVGTRLGLNRLQDGVWSRYTTGQGLPNDTVYALHEDGQGSLWVGTDGGLARFRDGRFTSFTLREGLFDDRIQQVLEDGAGQLWIGSSRGIFRVRTAELEEVARGLRPAVRSVAYGLGEGMRSVECNGGMQPSAWKGRDGRLWFATMKGLAVVDPRFVEEEAAAPPVVIEEAIVDGQPLGPQPAETGPGSRQFEFHYTALSLRSPERVRFRYRLDGVDSDWVDAGVRRIAYYTSLPPGRHRFRVSATAGGPWSEPGASLDLRVRPHFRQTPWFYALCMAAVGTAGFGAHRYRLRRLLELERVRTRIASDLHDDIGASLSRMAILSEVAKREYGAPAARPEQKLDEIAETARGLVDSMSEIVWSVDPRHDDLESVVRRLREFAADVLAGAGLRWEVSVPPDLDGVKLGPEDRRHLFLLLKEAVHNVARHARASAASLRLELVRGTLVAEVQDNGRGFDTGGTGAPPSGHGLENMRMRAARLGAGLQVDSSPGGGTRVVLTVPLK
jgi:ligand-binding sensor domain-containing protein/two-component sensor histidine kinase